MPRRLSIFTAICVLVTNGCEATTSDLWREAIGKTHGAAFGRVNAFMDRKDVTEGCRIFLTAGTVKSTQTLVLDRGGWVFTAVEPGPATLFRVECAGQKLDAEDLKFNVPAGGKIAYFGHIRVIFPNASGPAGDTAGAVAGAILAGALTGRDRRPHLVDSAPAPATDAPDAWYRVNDSYTEAVTEYLTRFGADSRALEPVSSIVTGGAPPVPEPAPATFLGFTPGKKVAAAEASCTGAGLVWKTVEDELYSCSNTPVDTGIPVTADIATCAGNVSEIALNANPDGAAWSALVQRFVKLSTLLAGSHGQPHQRDTAALDDCTEEIERCFARGRVRTSATWRWPDRQNLTIRLDGGPAGGAPSLTVVYNAAALCRAKPTGP